VFELTDEQKKFLTDHGVSQSVVSQLDTLNQQQKQQIIQTLAPSTQQQIISKPQ
jgi:hypothetical protein